MENVSYDGSGVEETYPRLDFFNADEFKQLRRELVPRAKASSHEQFIDFMRVELTFVDLHLLEESGLLTLEMLMMLLNYLQLIAHARRMNVLFTIIDVIGASDEQLEYEQVAQNNLLYIKDH
jgi:hypothetical protein